MKSLVKYCGYVTQGQSGDSFMCLWKEVQQCIRAIKEELSSLDSLPLWADEGVSSALAAKLFSPSVNPTSLSL